MRNLFCDHRDLRNEADVEQNFARRLIETLGYSDRDIRPKAALEELSVGRLSNARMHRPDFAMKSRGHIRWVLEAKTPGERLDRRCQGRRDIRPWGGAKVYHRDVSVQHKCHPATGVSRSR